MNLFNAEDVRGVADLVRSSYDTDIVMEMYASIESSFQELVAGMPPNLGDGTLEILISRKHDDNLMERAWKDGAFGHRLIKASDLVEEFHKKYEGSIHRLKYCATHYKTVGTPAILNNLGKAAVLLKFKPPFAF